MEQRTERIMEQRSKDNGTKNGEVNTTNVTYRLHASISEKFYERKSLMKRHVEFLSIKTGEVQ